MTNSIQNHKSNSPLKISFPNTIKMTNIFDAEQQAMSPLLGSALADTIQIIKTNGQLICSYKTVSHIKMIAIQQIRHQVVEHSRKLSLEAYENYIVQDIINGLYVYYRIRNNVIVYVIACSSYSYTVAEEFMNNLTNILDQTFLQIFGQNKLPKFISQTNLMKLQCLQKKVDILMKQITNTKNRKSANISKKSQNLLKFVNECSVTIYTKSQQKKEIQMKNEKFLTDSAQLKAEAKKLSTWMACKKYMLYVFLIATVLIGFYIFWMYF